MKDETKEKPTPDNTIEIDVNKLKTSKIKLNKIFKEKDDWFIEYYDIKEKIKSYYIANDIDKILDYITNLQEENDRLKQSLFKSANNTNKAMEQTEIYKSRNEKAIELLNRHDIDTGDIYYKNNNRFVKSELKERIREILGGDEE